MTRSRGSTTTLTGGNIVGTDVFQGNTDVGDTTRPACLPRPSTSAAACSPACSPTMAGRFRPIALKDGCDESRDRRRRRHASAPTTDARGLARADFPGVANNGANISDLGAFEARTTCSSSPRSTMWSMPSTA